MTEETETTQYAIVYRDAQGVQRTYATCYTDLQARDAVAACAGRYGAACNARKVRADLAPQNGDA